MSPRSSWRGEVVWITGASAGIGRALAIEVARRGAVVALSGRRAAELEDTARDIEASDGRALVVPCDVTDEDQVLRAVDEIVAREGALHTVVANAGFAVTGAFASLSQEDWRRQLDTNVVGAAVTVRHALPHLEKTRGRIALVGSVAAFAVTPGTAAYAASKAAVRAMGHALALEVAPLGISCTVLHPGLVESEIGRVDNDGQFRAEWSDRRPKALMWRADRAAVVMADAIERRELERVFTGHGVVAAFLGQHFPGVLHGVTKGARAFLPDRTKKR